MAEFLEPDGTPVLIDDVEVISPGLTGMVEVHYPGAARARGPEAVDDTLRSALDRSGLIHQVTVEIGDHAEDPATAECAPAGLASHGEAGLTITVPGPGTGLGQVLLASDESGMLRWVFADDLSAVQRASRGDDRRSYTTCAPLGARRQHQRETRAPGSGWQETTGGFRLPADRLGCPEGRSALCRPIELRSSSIPTPGLHPRNLQVNADPLIVACRPTQSGRRYGCSADPRRHGPHVHGLPRRLSATAVADFHARYGGRVPRVRSSHPFCVTNRQRQGTGRTHGGFTAGTGHPCSRPRGLGGAGAELSSRTRLASAVSLSGEWSWSAPPTQARP